MEKKKIISGMFLAFSFFSLLFISADEKQDKIKAYEKEKISLEITREFNPLYPQDTKIFYFKRGEETLSFKHFLELSQDPGLLKNEARIKTTKINCIASAAVFGATTVGFLIPSAIFIAMQTNNNKVPPAYTLSGNVTVAMTGVSALGLIIDMIVFFSLLYKYRYDEPAVRQAVERYNEKLMDKLGILPDISFSNENLDLNFVLRF